MICIKQSAGLLGLTPQALLAFLVFHSILQDLDIRDTWLTEGTAGQHSRGSLHFVGNAIDVRRSNIPLEDFSTVLRLLKKALGPSYDVVEEPTHIHIEYQPKVGQNLPSKETTHAKG